MDPDANRFYIATPIYYVNGSPHIGHATTTLWADALARYHRLKEDRVFFLTGTDEHGLKVARAARAFEVPPLEYCDQVSNAFKSTWERLNISNDDFIRTTQPRHTAVVQSALATLYRNGSVYRGEYSGFYCVFCERFVDQETESSRGCPECGREVGRITEPVWFLKLSAHQEWLIDTIERNPGLIRPSIRANEVLGFLRKPLRDLCISRPRARGPWGIELPFDASQVCYVWFDALLNYISAIGCGLDTDGFAQWWPASVQVLAKDILTQHAVYWPIILRSLGLSLPQTILAHGWWRLDNEKIGKSKGNAVSIDALIGRFGSDGVRYCLLAGLSLEHDREFSLEALVGRYNADLANTIGNFASRAIHLAEAGSGTSGAPPSLREEIGFSETRQRRIAGIEECFDEHDVSRAITLIVDFGRACNQYLEQTHPWTLSDMPEDRRRYQTIVGTSLEALEGLSILLSPIVPAKAAELRAALNLGEPFWQELHDEHTFKPGGRIEKLPPLFPRIDAPVAAPFTHTDAPAVGSNGP